MLIYLLKILLSYLKLKLFGEYWFDSWGGFWRGGNAADLKALLIPNNIPVYGILFICSSVEGHLSCSTFLLL